MQPVSGGQYVAISGTAAGTTTLIPRPCVLERIIVGTTTTGTVEFLDLAAAGTGNSVYTYAGSATPFRSFEMGIQFKNGLTAVYGGTLNFLAIVS